MPAIARAGAWPHTAVQVAGGKDLKDAGDNSGDDSQLKEGAAVSFVTVLQDVERSDRRHDKRGRDHRSAHVMRVLQPRPGIQHEAQKLLTSKTPPGRMR